MGSCALCLQPHILKHDDNEDNDDVSPVYPVAVPARRGSHRRESDQGDDSDTEHQTSPVSQQKWPVTTATRRRLHSMSKDLFGDDRLLCCIHADDMLATTIEIAKLVQGSNLPSSAQTRILQIGLKRTVGRGP